MTLRFNEAHGNNPAVLETSMNVSFRLVEASLYEMCLSRTSLSSVSETPLYFRPTSVKVVCDPRCNTEYGQTVASKASLSSEG